MKNQQTIIFILLCLSIGYGSLPPIQLASSSFPLGLVLTYRLMENGYDEWVEKYEILHWAPELGESVLVLNFTSTQGIEQSTVFYVDISTWALLSNNGSSNDQLVPPTLWVDFSHWRLGDVIQIPPYLGEYHVSSNLAQLSLGTFPCWQASSIAWLSLDDDYQQVEENWFFHQFSGILIKHTITRLPSQHIIYTSTYVRELVSSNLHAFGILTNEQLTQLMLQKLGGLLIGFILVLIVSLFLVNRKQQIFNRC
ncbi:MAG: hypothetical protein ACFFD8_04415 [Candidatus Thorarchaeota archaeon]